MLFGGQPQIGWRYKAVGVSARGWVWTWGGGREPDPCPGPPLAGASRCWDTKIWGSPSVWCLCPQFAVDPNGRGGEIWTRGGSCCKFWGSKSLTGVLGGSGVVSRCLETKSQLGHLRVASWWEHPGRLGGVLEMKAVPWGLPFLGSQGASHSSLTTAQNPGAFLSPRVTRECRNSSGEAPAECSLP